jgi:hypothetical protein
MQMLVNLMNIHVAHLAHDVDGISTSTGFFAAQGAIATAERTRSIRFDSKLDCATSAAALEIHVH